MINLRFQDIIIKLKPYDTKPYISAGIFLVFKGFGSNNNRIAIGVIAFSGHRIFFSNFRISFWGNMFYPPPFIF
jgi:hypothetical protein